MLIEFRVKNFKSYKTEQVLSLVSTGKKDPALPDNLIQARIKSGKTQETDLTLVSSAVIYGANASGKSNLIDAIKFVEGIITNEQNPLRQSKQNSIEVKPFLLSKLNKANPIEFELTFLIEQVRYQYGFKLDNKKIHEEWLIAFPNGVAQTWFERSLIDVQTEKPEYNWTFQAGKYRKSRTEIKDKTRPSVLFLTVAAEFNDGPLIEVYNWFLNNLNYIYTDDFSPLFTLSFIDQNFAKQQQVLNLLKEADLGICNLSLDKTDFTPESLPSGLPDALRERLLSELKNSKKLNVKLAHYTDDSDTLESFPLEKESFGTRRLFELGGFLIHVLDNGFTLFVDELEANLHPLLVRKLVGLFGDKSINQKGAQLIFTTHNVNLLNEDILRRDQIWFVEKQTDGSSNLYPLTDIHPRKNEALEKNYLEGRYGAIPNLGTLVESR